MIGCCQLFSGREPEQRNRTESEAGGWPNSQMVATKGTRSANRIQFDLLNGQLDPSSRPLMCIATAYLKAQVLQWNLSIDKARCRQFNGWLRIQALIQLQLWRRSPSGSLWPNAVLPPGAHHNPLMPVSRYLVSANPQEQPTSSFGPPVAGMRSRFPSWTGRSQWCTPPFPDSI